MYVLALTGSIATGKSTVLKMFNDQNISSISADEIVHDLYKNEAIDLIKDIFPKAIKNSQVDRKKLSEILISSPKAMKKLEDIIHPLVQKKIKQFINKSKQENKNLIVLEIPLLFESENKYPFDAIVLTICNEEIQRKRALSREGMNEKKFNLLLSRQMPQSEKITKADFIIDTSKSLKETQNQVKKLISSILIQT